VVAEALAVVLKRHVRVVVTGCHAGGGGVAVGLGPVFQIPRCVVPETSDIPSRGRSRRGGERCGHKDTQKEDRVRCRLIYKKERGQVRQAGHPVRVLSRGNYTPWRGNFGFCLESGASPTLVNRPQGSLVTNTNLQ
jgi:hypothetical protein